MHQCVNCHSTLTATRLSCNTCGIRFGGEFLLPRLARLSPEQQHLTENLVLAAGSLKQVSAWLNVSYPTLRKRVDELINALNELRDADEATTARVLDEVEQGQRSAESAARLIQEMRGGL